MALPLIGGLLGAVGDIAGSWVKGKVEKSHHLYKSSKSKS